MDLSTYIDANALLEVAIRSELDYYQLSARVATGPGWIATQMPGFEHVVSAGYCCCDLVPSEPAIATKMLAATESAAHAMGAIYTRLYTRDSNPMLRSVLGRLGFQSRRESIHVHNLHPPPAVHVDAVDETPVLAEAAWQAKEQLHSTSMQLSDGHNAAAADWVRIQRRKAATGSVAFFLYQMDGTAVATAGLMRSGSVIRIKDVFVHPDYRRKRIARTALALLCRHVEDAPVVLFALDGSAGHQLYRSMGFETVGSVYEWIRVRRGGNNDDR